MTSITTRRRFMTAACAISAGAISMGLAIAASPAVCLIPDPIFAAIDAHRQAVTVWEEMHAALLTASNGEDLPVQEAPAELQAAFSATYAPMAALIATVPTTLAGVSAFESYILEDSVGSHMVRHLIASRAA